MTETGVIAMYISEREMEREQGGERAFMLVRGRKEGGGSYKNTHPDAHNTIKTIKRLIGKHALTDGQWWKYTLKIQTGCR